METERGVREGESSSIKKHPAFQLCRVSASRPLSYCYARVALFTVHGNLTRELYTSSPFWLNLDLCTYIVVHNPYP